MQGWKFYSLLAWQVGLTALVGVLLALPANYFDEGETLCFWKRSLGVECPGCGLTRATQHFLHGEWEIALDYNPLVVIVVAFFGIIWGVQLIALIRYGRTYFSRSGQESASNPNPPEPQTL